MVNILYDLLKNMLIKVQSPLVVINIGSYIAGLRLRFKNGSL